MGIQRKYLLEWIDILISVTLNPEKTDISSIRQDQAQYIIENIDTEKEKIKSCLMSHVFSGNDVGQIKNVICQYHDTLIILLDHTIRNERRISQKRFFIRDIYKALTAVLDEILSFIEIRFFKYLSLSERVPATYLAVTKKEICRKLNKLKTKPINNSQSSAIVNIVLKRLSHYSKVVEDYTKITFRDILYQKELIKGLEDVNWECSTEEAYSALDQLVIYLNFNSKAYINHLTGRLAQKINECNTSVDKMDKLLFYYKAFNQLHRKPDTGLNPQYHDLGTIMNNWFSQEILYLEKKLRIAVIPTQGETEPVKQKENPKQNVKVLCILSSDQTGLILRAADELRILIAKSMNEVFKTIVPHLSTPYKDDLSYDGMRSKSYVAEERDKQIAIETLERIIKKIRDY